MTPAAVAPMNPPRTATSPAARRAPTTSQVRLQVASMSGSAAMCSSSVTSTARASIHAVCTPFDANAADTIWLLASSPIATIASCEDGDTSRCRARVRTVSISAEKSADSRATRADRRSGETSAFATPACRSSRSLRSFAASSPEPSAASRADSIRRSVTFDIAETTTTGGVAGALRARWSRTIAITRSIASASATEVPPNFMMTFTAGPLGASARRSGSRRQRRRGWCCGPAR